ncbi:MAG TPA: hypothetical protein VMW70_02445 [Burkholderiales bacterium]|nr:hypothetical protein [Burkholderiales bacterium]
MSIETLTGFFMWCSIISTGIYCFWALCVVLVPDWIYRTQTRWFPIPRETYNVAIFSFMGAFKIVLIVFIIVPYVSLLIVA